MDKQNDMKPEQDVRVFIMETIFPMVARRFPDAASDMSIRVMGSYGLGVQDILSDLEVSLLLNDDLWQSEGGHSSKKAVRT